jgi:hypothetical protein
MLSRRLIPDFQSPTMGHESSPDVFACQAFAHFPCFVEHRKCAVRFDLANEMDASSCNWQWMRQVPDASRGQAMSRFATLRLLGSRLAQQRRRIVGHIPVDKGRTGLTHAPERRKQPSFPEGVCPQAIQLFDLAIAFGFGDGQEDQFDAQIQTQPNELPEDARGLVAAAKGGIVVELQKLRDSQGFPGVETMPDHGVAAFVGRNGLRTGARSQVQSVERIDLGTVFEIATCPIHCVQDSVDPPQGFGKVSGSVLARCGNQVALLQNPIDRGQRWSLFVQHLAKFASDRTRSPQAHFLLDQSKSRLDNQPHDTRRTGTRRVMWTPRARVQS